jgi:hypothetical protein
MTPSAFRDLPRHDQIEMMAHRREVLLRKAHAEDAQRKVSEEIAREEREKR